MTPTLTSLIDTAAGVVFDFDGTLAELTIDFPPLYTRVFEMSQKYDVDTTRLTERYLIEVIDEIASIISGDDGAKFRRDALDMIIAEELNAAKNASLFPGARQLIRALKARGKRVALVTRNCRDAVLTVYPEITSDVDVFLPRDDVKRIKPDPEHLQRALFLMGTEAEMSIMVGDHPIDVTSAQAVGMESVGVLTGKASHDDLKSAGALFVLDRASDMIEHLTD
ncbi:MAG: HAD family hydrolase [Deltaproteobacteria bacterium]|nr:HAD family hydrolase [Candidatus Zymogenaceae bacterium]